MTRISRPLVPRAAWTLLAAVTLLAVPPATASAAVPFFATPKTVADLGAATRPYGVAAGDFDSDGRPDVVVGRVTGNVHLVKGRGNGTFEPAVQYAWKQAFFNAWSMAPGDVNGDGRLDVVWGATADSPATSPQVSDGEVRAWLGNGDGTFQEQPYAVGTVRHNKGILLADVGTDAGSLAVADVDGDGDQDVVVGSTDGANSSVKLLRNAGSGAFTTETVLSQPSSMSGDGAAPTYFPAISPVNSPWGLAFGDADGDGDDDLFVGDRALYVYLFANDGAGRFTVTPGNLPGLGSRPNVYLRHDASRVAVGFTPSVAAGDVNADGRADVIGGLQSGTQTPAGGVAHDGEILLDLSTGGRHEPFGTLADVGTNARGLQVADFDADGHDDIVAAEYDGKVKLLRQLEPRDSDADGVSDYVDNAPGHPNAPRIDMDTDGAVTSKDQLDNDGDTVLGDPEDPSTWRRLGDPADPDDDNDGVDDAGDNCRLDANAGQSDADGDDRGDACDPLDGRDHDGDGVPDGPMPGDELFEASRQAAIRWSLGDTHFVIRIDALGRFFQNEFTGLMTDAAISSSETWPSTCQGMYNGTDPDPGCADLPGGKSVPVSLVVIPRLLWTDPEVISWIDDRNDNPRLEVGQHGTYHASNTMLGDWSSQADRNFFSCELCGFDAAESEQLLRVGYDTLTGDYGNPFLRASGAASTSPRIDWSSSANPLISYAPPFNASDGPSRDGTASLGFKAFSASVHEEDFSRLGRFFSPEGNWHERFDQFGMFHASADTELEPPAPGQTPEEYAAYLRDETNHGDLTTWLIEEVEWSGRPCNELDRLEDLCNGGSNRENNTVYRPRWDGWMQLLEHVDRYPGGVAMTLGEVALAKGYDNAPTVANPGQADEDHDGVGDVIEGVEVEGTAASLSRNRAGELSARVANGNGDPLADQIVTFAFDMDGDGAQESFEATTGADGTASASVIATRPVGPATFTASWDGGRGIAASGSGDVDVTDATELRLAAANPSSGQVTDSVTVSATLLDTDGRPIAGRTVMFSIGADTASASTGAGGVASATLIPGGPAGARTLQAEFAPGGGYGASSDGRPFEVLKEDTVLTLEAPVTVRGRTTAELRLVEADGAGLAGRTVELLAEVRQRGEPSFTVIGSFETGPDGRATATIPPRYRNDRLRAQFAGDPSFLASSDSP